jgi:hypothetical protein
MWLFSHLQQPSWFHYPNNTNRHATRNSRYVNFCSQTLHARKRRPIFVLSCQMLVQSLLGPVNFTSIICLLQLCCLTDDLSSSVYVQYILSPTGCNCNWPIPSQRDCDTTVTVRPLASVIANRNDDTTRKYFYFPENDWLINYPIQEGTFAQ